jgi:hypothetical protein
MNKHQLAGGGGALLLLLSSNLVQASPIFGAQTIAYVDDHISLDATGFVEVPTYGPNMGSGSYSGVDRLGNPVTMLLSYSASASAGHGFLKAAAAAQVVNGLPSNYNAGVSREEPNWDASTAEEAFINPLGVPSSIVVSSYAWLHDTIGFNGSSEMAYVDYDLDITGSSRLDGDTNHNWGVGEGFGCYLNAVSGCHSSTIRVYASAGSFHEISLDLLVEANLRSYGFSGAATDITTANLLADLDYSHTLRIGNFRAFDEAGNSVELTSVTGSDGAKYEVYRPASSAPEPGVLALLSLGLITAGISKRRSK